MTINVSVRVPDGIVIASDSLASSFVPLKGKIQFDTKCQKCGHEMGRVIPMPPIGMPGSSTPLANKLFYMNNYGLAFFGQSSINGRSLFNHVLVYRTKEYRSGMKLGEIADGLARQLAAAAAADSNLRGAPPGTELGGFQICGYDDEDIDIGRTSIVNFKAGQGFTKNDCKDEYSVTVTGVGDVVQKLFSNPAGAASAKPNFSKMTLPDAIDYARFLVQTTSDYQRFADMVPTVGGPTEIAVITKWIGFRWIQRKRILGDECTRLNMGKISQEIEQIRKDLPDIIRQSRAEAPPTCGGGAFRQALPPSTQLTPDPIDGQPDSGAS